MKQTIKQPFASTSNNTTEMINASPMGSMEKKVVEYSTALGGKEVMNIVTVNTEKTTPPLGHYNINSHTLMPPVHPPKFKFQVNDDFTIGYGKNDSFKENEIIHREIGKTQLVNDHHTNIYIHAEHVPDTKAPSKCYDTKSCCCDIWFIGKIATAGILSGSTNWYLQHYVFPNEH